MVDDIIIQNHTSSSIKNLQNQIFNDSRMKRRNWKGKNHSDGPKQQLAYIYYRWSTILYYGSYNIYALTCRFTLKISQRIKTFRRIFCRGTPWMIYNMIYYSRGKTLESRTENIPSKTKIVYSSKDPFCTVNCNC